ncbi:MAG: hypothetical protein KZQ95_21935 [Candidatus Thiodiazotropha sp. (ex Epidulcina cf. delphinae)]|nr:hypothetical protein [Candidatus Thiodiazotropha sp. (ex Epidulcina cf. delphinae)]
MKDSALTLQVTVIILLLATQGCGGGGGSSDDPTDTGDPTNNDNQDDNTSNTYTGSETQAVVDETSAKDLAITAASGVKRAVDESGMVLPSQPAAAASKPTQTVVPMGTMDEDSTAALCPHGGRATVEYWYEGAGLINIFTLTNCSYGEGMHLYTFTGTYHATYADAESDSSAFTQVIAGRLTTVAGVTREIHHTLSCTEQWRSCTSSSDFNGLDGRLYRETEVAVTEEGNMAYTAEGRIYDPFHGYINVTTGIPFTLECPEGHPGSGRLNFTGANQTSGSIEFVSCAEYVVTTGSGTSNTYSW